MAAVSFLILSPSWQVTFQGKPIAIEYDNGQFFTRSQQVLEGYVPYADMPFDKPPVLLYIAAGAFSLGLDWHYLILLTILVTSVNLALVGLTANKLYGSYTAFLAFLLLAVDPLALQYGRIFNLETWATFFGNAAILLALISCPKNPYRLTLAGIFMGLAFLTTQTSLVLPLVLLLLIFLREEFTSRRLLREGALLALGSSTVLVPWLAYLLATRSVGAFFDNVYVAEVRYSHGALNESLMRFLSQAPFAPVNGYQVNEFGWFLVGIFLVRALYNACSGHLLSKETRSDLLTMVWFITIYFVIDSANYQWPHRIVFVSSVMAIMGARSLVLIVGALKKTTFAVLSNLRRRLLPERHIFLSLAILSLLVIEVLVLASAAPQNVMNSGIDVGYGDYDSQVQLTQFIQEHTRPTDTIISLFQPYLYYLAHRAPAVRNAFLGPMDGGPYWIEQVAQVSSAIRNGEAAAVVVTNLPPEVYILDLMKSSTIYKKVDVSFSLWYTIGFSGAIFLRVGPPLFKAVLNDTFTTNIGPSWTQFGSRAVADGMLVLGPNAEMPSGIQSLQVFRYGVFHARIRISTQNVSFGFNRIGDANNVVWDYGSFKVLNASI
jgi:hypothetical protein